VFFFSELDSRGNDLKELVSLGREGTTVILDEVPSTPSSSTHPLILRFLI